MNLDLLTEREIEDLFGWPSCPEPAPWAYLCQHATPVPEDHDEMLFGLRTVERARVQP